MRLFRSKKAKRIPARTGDSSAEYAIVIPALNPGRDLLAYCRALLNATPHPVYLVDDGSDPGVQLVFERCAGMSSRIHLLRHGVNRGKGRALKTAFAEILARNPAVKGCVTCDSDGQHAPDDVIRCLEELEANPESLVMGCRRFSGKNVPFKSRFGNNFMRALFLVATGKTFRDTQTGLRGIPTSLMRELLDVPGERFEFETAMLLRLRDREIRQPWIKTIYHDGNRGTHFRPIADSALVSGVLIRHLVAVFGLFIFVSALSAAIDLSLFSLFFFKKFAALGAWRLAASVGAARGISALFNYICNRNAVFRRCHSRERLRKHPFKRYLVLASILALVSFAGTAFAASRLRGTWPDLVVAKAAIDASLFIFSFAVQRTLVF